MLTNFLMKTRASLESLSEQNYVIVMGNEACDLDSIACSTSYAYIKAKEDSKAVYIPYCGIPQADMTLRTEASYWLESCDINKNDLFYAGSLNKLLANKKGAEISLILVDHVEVSSRSNLRPFQVLEIIDHHPLSPGFVRPDTCQHFCVDRVGSCASLITHEMVKRLPRDLIPLQLCGLLYGAILIDTVGLSEAGKKQQRVHEKDIAAAEKLEDISSAVLLPDGSTRESIYQRIADAKFYVLDLTLWDLLRRDMKTVSVNPEALLQIACSTITGMDYNEVVNHADFGHVAIRFCEEMNAKILVCVTVGMTNKDSRRSYYTMSTDTENSLRRGLVVTSLPAYRHIASDLWQYLLQDAHVLRLETPPNACAAALSAKPHIYAATITNPAATRKQVVPCLIDFLRLQK